MRLKVNPFQTRQRRLNKRRMHRFNARTPRRLPTPCRTRGQRFTQRLNRADVQKGYLAILLNVGIAMGQGAFNFRRADRQLPLRRFVNR